MEILLIIAIILAVYLFVGVILWVGFITHGLLRNSGWIVILLWLPVIIGLTHEYTHVEKAFQRMVKANGLRPLPQRPYNAARRKSQPPERQMVATDPPGTRTIPQNHT